MNGVLCAGNKGETNYVIIQLLLVCHSQIKCQMKVRGHSVCLMECEATCSRVWQQGGMAVKSTAWTLESAGTHTDWIWCWVLMTSSTFNKCSQTQVKSCLPKMTRSVHSGEKQRPGRNILLRVKCLICVTSYKFSANGDACPSEGDVCCI